MQHFLQVESTPPASSGHMSEILPPTWRGGEGRRGRGVRKQRRGIGRKGPLLWTWGSWCVETGRPVCVGAAQGLNGADQEVKGRRENREQGAGQSFDAMTGKLDRGFWEQCRDKDNLIDLSQGDLGGLGGSRELKVIKVDFNRKSSLFPSSPLRACGRLPGVFSDSD